MMRLGTLGRTGWVAAAICLGFGCSSEDEPTPDSGVNNPPADSGTPRPDSGVSTPDSGMMMMMTDGGSPDSGINPMGTNLSGRVLDTDQAPLENVTVSFGARTTLTSSTGAFALMDVDVMETVLVVDGTTADPRWDGRVYPRVAERVQVQAGSDIVFDAPFYLPATNPGVDISMNLDMNGTVVTPFTFTQDSDPEVTGTSLAFAAGTQITFPQGVTDQAISMTRVAFDRTPASLPPGFASPMVVTLQPSGTQTSTPVPIRFPAPLNLADGLEQEIWSLDNATGEFVQVGTGRIATSTVTGNKEVVPDPGTGVSTFSWHTAVCRPTAIEGLVKDQLGNVIQGAEVHVKTLTAIGTNELGRVQGGTGTTNSQGHYAIPNQRACTLYVWATKEVNPGEIAQSGLTSLTYGEPLVQAPDLIIDLTQVRRVFDIAVHVEFTDNAPVEGAYISAYAGGPEGGRGQGSYYSATGRTNRLGDLLLEDAFGTAGGAVSVNVSFGAQYLNQQVMVPATAGSTQNVTFQIQIPGPPILVLPADLATNVAVTPRLQWTPTDPTATYVVVVGTDMSFTSPLVSADTGRRADYQIAEGVLATTTQYYWRVVATTVRGQEPSATFSFTTGANAGSTLPVLVTPANNATNVPIVNNQYVDMAWNAPASGQVSYYFVHVAGDPNFQTFVGKGGGQGGTTAQVWGQYAPNTQYWWKVVAYFVDQAQSESVPFTFTTAP